MAQSATAVQGYSATTRWLHWLTAIVVIATIPVGVIMTGEGLTRELRNSLYIFHKNVGVVIILLVAARLLARAVSPTPPLPKAMPGWQKRAASLTHVALYVLLLVMAVSGYIRVVAGGFPIEMLNAIGMPPLVPRSDPLAETAQWVHSNARFALAAVIAMHVGAALHHGLVKRDGVFSRMWRPSAVGR